jgi:SanA protein
MKRKKIFLFSILGLLVGTLLVIVIANLSIERSARGKLYSDAGTIPYNKVGLLLGTSKMLANGYVNLYYRYRIEAAADLFRNQKIRYIIISGDNSRKEYNEPMDMRSDLMAAGVDSSRIYLDYAGFRTFDSMVRLKEIFDVDTVTVISQQFHNERAIFIGSKEGIAAIGFNARDVDASSGLKVAAREKLARVKVFVDYLFGKKPKFLGEKVRIPE